MTAPGRRAAARFDLHVHSQYSPDGRGTLKELAAQARRRGLDGFIASDHNTTRMWDDVRRDPPRDLLVVPGIEVSTREGHLVAVGVRELVPRGRTMQETLERCRDAGGVGVPAHPYRRVHGCGEAVLRHVQASAAAIEVVNAGNGRSRANASARRFADAHGLGGTGGSDAHRVVELGNAYTAFPERPQGVDDVVSMIERKTTWGEGRPTPLRVLGPQKVKNAVLWVRRGMRSI